MENWQRGGFGLYVHWPFCAAKCPYCDFNSHVVDTVEQDRWRSALLRDLDHWAERTPDRVLGSIFFGGGTPSLMPPETVGAVIDAARRHWTAANDLEVTLEANPTSVEIGRFGAFRDAGINRISVGVQAMDDGALRRLGRLHDVAQARRAVETAQAVVDRVSFDLIYARQDQTLDDWRTELAEALKMADGHLSLYQLTIEDGTAFAARRAAGGLRGLPDEDLAADMFEATQELCSAAGLPRYEVSNHAATGEECRHNLVYWNSGDWIGVGPGAHGRVDLIDGRHATIAARAPQDWLVRNERSGTGTVEDYVLQASDIEQECVLMGLRTTSGIDLLGPGGPLIALNMEAITLHCRAGRLDITDGRLRATDSGIILLNSILADITDLVPAR